MFVHCVITSLTAVGPLGTKMPYVCLTLLARIMNNLIVYAHGACNKVRDCESSCRMQSQLQSFQSVSVVWVTDGRGKDTKR